MTDNTTLNSGSGGDVIATDDIGGGVKIQRVKVAFGVDGSAADVTAAAPLPITAPSAISVTGAFYQATQPVSGAFFQATQPVSAAGLPLPTGAATEAAAQDILSALSTPATELPPPGLSTTKRLARATASSSTATTTSLVGATASQTTRLHRSVISVAGACLFEFLDGTTNAKTIRFPGAGIVILDFSSEPWVITTANTALQYKTSAAVQVDVDVEYVKSA